MRFIETGHKPIKAWTDGVEFEEQALDQVRCVATLPFIFKHVAVMPDVHWGIGATVGSVIATQGAVIPAAVGVDIGCGMLAQRWLWKQEQLPDDLGKLRAAMEKVVPVGTPSKGHAEQGSWPEAPPNILGEFEGLKPRLVNIIEKHPKVNAGRGAEQLGTLGGGNHFIELCIDEDGYVWTMLHSGSRSIGNRIGTYFIDLARKDMQTWMINLPDRDLAYLPEGTKHFDDYIEAVSWAQDYAAINRQLMLGSIFKALQKVFDDLAPMERLIECHHNYVSRENHFGQNVIITRKGAVQAREGQLGIIPGSMGTRSYIVSGKGNPESFMSCSHGAGRRMGRNEARRQFTLADHEAATSGVECRKDDGVLDETPGAYKDIDAVIEAESDLITVKHTLKQVICIKG